MKRIIVFIKLFVFIMLYVSCGNSSSLASDDEKTNIPPIDIPKGKVTVAAYYFPNWGPVVNSEWSVIQHATPKFTGHKQPKVPLWGYTNENTPEAMEQKIDAAAENGVDVFIFDWYWHDEDQMSALGTYNISGCKYLYMALENGFFKAKNRSKMKFAILWCNHDLGTSVTAKTKPETVDKMMDYVIENYFKDPSYWLIDGCPYFSIYQIKDFMDTYVKDGQWDYEMVKEVLNKFEQKTIAAGFKGLHLDCSLWGMGGIEKAKVISQKLPIKSISSYVWVHHSPLVDFPTTNYEKWADKYMQFVKMGGGYNGLESGASAYSVPYYMNVSMGWDSSPRCGNVSPSVWAKTQGYPYGAVIVNNTPYLFKKYLAEAKKWTLNNYPDQQSRFITINSWNEWGEGSYLEPDKENKMGYLEAIKEVFKDN